MLISKAYPHPFEWTEFSWRKIANLAEKHKGDLVAHDGGSKKTIVKLLDVEAIYPFFDNKRVNPINVVPKKIGITIVQNSDGEFIPTRV